MKLSAMAWTVTKTALASGGGGVLAFIGLSWLLPLVTIDDLFGNNWAWTCGMLGAVTGVLIVATFVGNGYQLSVPRWVMVWTYLVALAASAAAMGVLVIGYTQLSRVFGRELLPQVHGFTGFLQAGNLLVSWVYLFALGFAFGIVGLFYGLAMAYIRTKTILLLGFTVLPFMTFTAGFLIWALVAWLLPGFKAMTDYVGGHPWAQIGVLGGLALVLALIFAQLYQRLDAPRQVR